MKLDTFPNLDRQLLAGDELTTNDLAYGDARLDELHAAFTKLVREQRIYGFNFVFVIDNREYSVDFSEETRTLPTTPSNDSEEA